MSVNPLSAPVAQWLEHHLDMVGAGAELAVPTIFYITMTLLIVIIFRIQDVIWLKINLPLQQIIGNRLINRMMQQSQLFLQDQFSGSLGNKIKEVMHSVSDLLILLIHQFFCHALALFIAIFILWQVSIKCSLLLSGWIALFIT